MLYDFVAVVEVAVVEGGLDFENPFKEGVLIAIPEGETLVSVREIDTDWARDTFYKAFDYLTRKCVLLLEGGGKGALARLEDGAEVLRNKLKSCGRSRIWRRCRHTQMQSEIKRKNKVLVTVSDVGAPKKVVLKDKSAQGVDPLCRSGPCNLFLKEVRSKRR